VTLIGVKSKYGSGWGTSPGLININNTQKKACARCINIFIFIWFESIHRLTTFILGAYRYHCGLLYLSRVSIICSVLL